MRVPPSEVVTFVSNHVLDLMPGAIHLHRFACRWPPNLRDGGRHRRKTLRELFADGRSSSGSRRRRSRPFPLDRIIRAGSESAALEVCSRPLLP